MAFIDNWRRQQEAGQASAPKNFADFIAWQLGQKPLFAESSEYPAGLNALSEMTKYMGPLALPTVAAQKYFRATAPGNQRVMDYLKSGWDSYTDSMQEGWDWLTVPEKEVERRQQAQQQAEQAMKPAAPVNQTSPFEIAARKLQSGTPSSGPVDLFSFPTSALPSAPQSIPFQVPGAPELASMPLPPGLALPPRPVDQVGPDYSNMEALLKEGRPVAPTLESSKDLRRALGLGLAQGAAQWNPMSGWGALIAGATAPAAGQVTRVRENSKEEQKAYQDELRRYNMSLAQLEGRKAESSADLANSNRDRDTLWQNEVVKTQNANAQNRFEYDTTETQRKNMTALEAWKMDVQNLREVHESNRENAVQAYNEAVRKAELEQPQILETTKDGALISLIENGNRVLKFQKFNTDVSEDTDLKKIRDTMGEDAYELSMFNRLTRQGDQLGLMKEIARTAVEKGYAAEVFGEDVFQEARAAAEQAVGTAGFGTKEAAQKISDAMVSRLIRYVKLEDRAQLEALVLNGNNYAQYLLGAANGAN